MANAKQVAKEANANADVNAAVKALPALRTPMVKLPEEIRTTIAEYCRENETSFSRLTAQMWVDKLKAEKKIPADMVVDLTSKRGPGGGASKAQLEEAMAVIATLEQEIEALKKGKK